MMNKVYESIKTGLEGALDLTEGKVSQAVVHKISPVDVKGASNF